MRAHRVYRRQLAWLIRTSAALLLSANLCAQTADGIALNSERIEARFGSYGIEVLQSTGRLRVSNLYSGDGNGRITRTLAVVLYPESAEAAYAAEHAEILDGGSIGAVFRRNGWDVVKRNRYYGEVETTPGLSRLMRSSADARLAIHIYVLVVEKDGTSLPYASIAEVHHPEYLDLADVRRIYGRLEDLDSDAAEAMAVLVELTREELEAL